MHGYERFMFPSQWPEVARNAPNELLAARTAMFMAPARSFGVNSFPFDRRRTSSTLLFGKEFGFGPSCGLDYETGSATYFVIISIIIWEKQKGGKARKLTCETELSGKLNKKTDHTVIA